MAIIVPMQVTATNESVPGQVEENAENLPAAIDLRIGYKGEKGDTGVGIASCVLNPDYTLTINLTDGNSYTTESIRGAQGEKGADGQSGRDGRDGRDGVDGKDGENGQDGYSPTATVTKSGKVATITITDKNGTTTQTVSDGNDGQNGQNGQDGAAGQDGKSAYQYAVDGGYTGTEEQFAAKMAQAIPENTSDLNNDSGYITGMYIAAYGKSTYSEILAAYQANKVVYCRASSNANPATGNQLRMAFLAYVGAEATPTSFEFQYYRSVRDKSESQQGDQVFVYTLTSGNQWSVVTREASTKIVAGSGLSSSYNNGVLTLNLDVENGNGVSY